MSKPTDLTVAEAIACAICWLYRWRGPVRMDNLRPAISDRHGLTCDWCEFPPVKLLQLADLDFKTDPRVRTFERLPQLEQRRLVDRALHAETMVLA